MSEAQHTLGPWKATREKPFSYSITTDHPPGHANFGIVVHEVRCEANARLIAAAPALLEALEQIGHYTAKSIIVNPVPDFLSIAEICKAAIRKAKGE